jgi:hypothetical protein
VFDNDLPLEDEQSMTASLVEGKNTRVRIELTAQLSRSMPETEEAIQMTFNDKAPLPSHGALNHFDTDLMIYFKKTRRFV